MKVNPTEIPISRFDEFLINFNLHTHTHTHYKSGEKKAFLAYPNLFATWLGAICYRSILFISAASSAPYERRCFYVHVPHSTSNAQSSPQGEYYSVRKWPSFNISAHQRIVFFLYFLVCETDSLIQNNAKSLHLT